MDSIFDGDWLEIVIRVSLKGNISRLNIVEIFQITVRMYLNFLAFFGGLLGTSIGCCFRWFFSTLFFTFYSLFLWFLISSFFSLSLGLKELHSFVSLCPDGGDLRILLGLSKFIPILFF